MGQKISKKHKKAYWKIHNKCLYLSIKKGDKMEEAIKYGSDTEDSGVGGVIGGGEIETKKEGVAKKKWKEYALIRKVRKKVELYLEQEGEHTYNGFLLAVGITEKQLLEYINAFENKEGGDRYEIGRILKWGLMQIEEELEKVLRVHKGKQSAIGAMFILKSKFNWKEKEEKSGGVSINLVINGLDGGKSNG